MWYFFLLLATLTSAEVNERAEKPAIDRPATVLLVNGLYTSHLMSLVNLGEELVRRGHEVTLVANSLNGSNIYPDIAEKVGIRFVSSGYDPFWTKSSLRELHRQLFYGELGYSEMGFKMLKAVSTSTLMTKLKIEEMGIDNFDIVVCDSGIQMVGVYFHMIGKKSVILNTIMVPVFEKVNLEWPTPLPGAGQTDNLSFLERLLNTIVLRPLSNFGLTQLVAATADYDADYKRVFRDGADIIYSPGTRMPSIMTHTFGFEYPRPTLPLVEYVGPILSSSMPEMKDNLKRWLDSKSPKSVIFASVGSVIAMSSEYARAIVNGIFLSSPYSVVLVIEDNHAVLAEFAEHINSGRLFHSRWVAQQSLLKHPSLLMCVLHCGVNGVQESVLSSLPVICMPLQFDTFDTAVRVQSAGIGVSMYGKMDAVLDIPKVTSHMIAEAVATIVGGDYTRNISRLRKMYKLMGGVRRAADLIEFYEDVGYDHLVPSFIKYKWSWYQYYNVDVWAAVLVVMASVGFGLLYCVRKLCCRHCC